MLIRDIKSGTGVEQRLRHIPSVVTATKVFIEVTQKARFSRVSCRQAGLITFRPEFGTSLNFLFCLVAGIGPQDSGLSGAYPLTQLGSASWHDHQEAIQRSLKLPSPG